MDSLQTGQECRVILLDAALGRFSLQLGNPSLRIHFDIKAIPGVCDSVVAQNSFFYSFTLNCVFILRVGFLWATCFEFVFFFFIHFDSICFLFAAFRLFIFKIVVDGMYLRVVFFMVPVLRVP